jgi:hypothetical protein
MVSVQHRYLGTDSPRSRFYIFNPFAKEAQVYIGSTQRSNESHAVRESRVGLPTSEERTINESEQRKSSTSHN